MTDPQSSLSSATEASEELSPQAFAYVHSESMPGILRELSCTLVVTTYQAGKLALFRARNERLSLLLRTFPQAMGVAASRDRVAVGSQHQVWVLENNTDIARSMSPEHQHDACYLPRLCWVTGNIDIHEMAWGRLSASPDAPIERRVEGFPDLLSSLSAALWIVNTRFSCLCTPHVHYSFVPRWHPPFVTRLAADDRCHLNGLAMADGQPAAVTVFAETDTPGGWREHKRVGGCVIDVASRQTLARGLCMPHSPRIHNGKLLVLDSGRGSLVSVDTKDGHVECVARLPGYTRGLATCRNYAFVGLSRIRQETAFQGVPVAESPESLKCGVWVIELATGRVEGFLEFTDAVTEIFDVQLLPGVRDAHVIGLEKDTVTQTFVLPPRHPND